MTELTHDRCSELLRPYEEGRLSATESIAVQSHLAICEDCARERAGLRLLVSGDSASMTDAERARLRAGLVTAISLEHRSREEVAPLPPRTSLRERLWPGLRVAAAAAVVIGGFVFAATVIPGGSDGGGNDADTRAQSESAGAPGAAAGEAGPAPVFAFEASPAAVPAEDQAEVEEGPAQALRRASASAPYTISELQQLGRNQQPFTDFATAYSEVDAERLSDEYLEQLATSAPSNEVAAAVRTCGGEALADADRPVLPAFAAYEEVAGEQSLILGFVAAASDSGPLDRYFLWVWEGTDCARLTYSNFGKIRLRS